MWGGPNRRPVPAIATTTTDNAGRPVCHLLDDKLWSFDRKAQVVKAMRNRLRSGFVI
jgi:hypothetical protein